MKKKQIIVGLNFILILFAGTFVALGQGKEVDLKDKRMTVKMEKMPVGMVFGYLREVFDIPIGFEHSNLDKGQTGFRFSANSPGVASNRMRNIDGVFKIVPQLSYKEPKHTITINAENEKLDEVFNQIVNQMENYEWEINDGVVNVFPINGRDERIEKILELNVNKFTFEKGLTVYDVTTKLKLLPEVSKFFRENEIRFIGWMSGPSGALDAQYNRIIEKEMNFSNLTFRDLLNKITKIKRGAWIIRSFSNVEGEECIHINI